MTTKLVANRFRIQKPAARKTAPQDAAETSAPPAAAPLSVPQEGAVLGKITPERQTPGRGAKVPSGQMFFDPGDGFGDMTFDTARKAPAADAPSSAPPAEPGDDNARALDAISREGLTLRQLRMARRLAQKHNLPAVSDFDAVRLLRKAGIDPFQANAALEVVSSEHPPSAAAPSRAMALARQAQLPQSVKEAGLPSIEDRTAEAHIAEVSRIQREILRRRQEKSAQLLMRMAVFVGLPTVLAAIYFYAIATPFYATKSEFVIQQSEPSGPASGLGGMLKGSPLANSTDSITVQGYLQSQAAMMRLDEDNGFRSHYSSPEIDILQRLDPDASNAAAYKKYRRNVKISYDPTEGIIKMEVIAADPQVAVDISKSLIGYAEEQVDQLTARPRADQMAGAEQSYQQAERNLALANERVVMLQEKYKVLSSEAEIGLITGQISQLEGQLTQDRLSLAQMESNATPNLARMEPLKRRIATLESEIAILRAKLTENSQGGTSIARVQSELLVAQADVETRRLLLAQSLQATEMARSAANRQTRYLSISVNPIVADEAAYPRAFENTLVVMLIFLGLYLMLSMTAAVLREQVTA